MESHDARQPQSIEGEEHPLAFDLPGYDAPETLLAGVLARVGQLDAYLASDMPAAELNDATHNASWEVRAVAVHALGQREEKPAETLNAALRDDDALVRMAALRALGQLGEHAPLDQVVLALRDRDMAVRETAVEVLRTLPGQAVRPLLVAETQDESATVRVAALDALAYHNIAFAAHPVVHRRIEAMGAISAAYSKTRQWAQPFTQAFGHAWHIFLRQPAVLQHNWFAPVLTLLLADIAVILAAMQMTTNLHDISLLLGVVTTLSAAIGIAFAANLSHDAGSEITLATATSVRMILFCRLLVVIASTCLISGGASVAVALAYGQGPWGVIQLWLGPLLLISSLTLALVLLLGSWVAFIAACVLEAVQTLRINAGGQLLPLQHPALWQSNPLIFALALLFLLAAFLYAPRQSRFYKGAGDL